ncbi:MAG: 2,3-bisphosphoglycerate-independent phosphoglycerate mutase [Patescibacteria group bacterium]
MRPKIVLGVIDGMGVAPPWGGNATTLAKTAFINSIKQSYPYTTLEASGKAVGLPAGERGNSEVGHLTIGAGQVVSESLSAINTAVADGSFFNNPQLIQAFDRAKSSGKAVHIMGLISDGGIHSHINHLFALLDMAKLRGVTNICIQALTDGRDSEPFVAQKYLEKIQAKLTEIGFGKICTISGRYYAMDRDHRWERIEKTYRAMTEGLGPSAQTPAAAVAASYRDGFSDEFIIPTIIQGSDNSFQPIQDGDSIIFFNFRGDRAREITQALLKIDFNDFARPKILQDIFFVGFTFLQEGLPMTVAFRPRNVAEPLAVILSKAGLSQLHVAESEKYAHVTYFFNAGIEAPFAGEDRVVIPSPKVASYDQVPEMSTKEISEAVIKGLDQYDFIVFNYAAPDMVGHTGNLRSAIQACEAVDRGLKSIFEAMNKSNSFLIVTADHGNVEQMVNPKTGEPDTEHSNNPVPLFIISELAKNWSLRSGGLSDIAPTILTLLDLPIPSEMTGKNLIVAPEVAATPVATPATQPAGV